MRSLGHHPKNETGEKWKDQFFLYGNISNTRINECFITYPNTEKWVEKMRSR